MTRTYNKSPQFPAYHCRRIRRCPGDARHCPRCRLSRKAISTFIIPTAEGGGADRNFRAFTSVWKEKLGTDFEPGFYPGASGRVGYEIYMGKAEPNCYNLIFGNMGPEVLNWAMQPPSFDIDDYFYFGQVDKDPCCLFVGAESPLQTMDDIIAAAKTKRLNVGTSRMAHPASIGLLALGDKLGIDFNLIPLQGGKGTVAGAVTGEVDFSVLTSGSVIAAGDSVKTLLVFGKNIVGEALDNAPRHQRRLWHGPAGNAVGTRLRHPQEGRRRLPRSLSRH